MDQVFFPQHETVPHIAHVSGNLCSPVTVRIMDNTSQAYFPAADIHEKQQMLPDQPMLRYAFDGGKVRSGGDVLLGRDELLPVAALPAFRVGNDPMVIQYLPDGCRRNIVAKIAHRSGYAVIAPIGVSRLEEQNPFDDLRRDRLPAAFTLPLTGAVVLLPHQLLIPVVDRPRGVSLLDDRKQILVQFPPAIRQSFFLFVGIFRPLSIQMRFLSCES